jgi:hydrogenase/urease accessory protein HupE
MKKLKMLGYTSFLALALLPTAQAFAHGVSGSDAHTIAEDVGTIEKLFDFFILGAKHMLVGYDHLLFILGVVFLLAGFRDVVKYITYFTLGHSITLIFATLMGITFNYHIVDAIIGLSILYKGYDNLFNVKKKFNIPFDTKWIIFGFGLVHGFGLSTRLQALDLPRENLLAYIISFNIGVEVGQIIALAVFVWILNRARKGKHFEPFKNYTNQFLIGAGIFLFIIGMAKGLMG